ncbi:MAG: hypothetical protein MUC83_06445 [Pirellula sp.]|jgi:hypothetical protein|nr:hypothetical protein [Pirellula sp.]
MPINFGRLRMSNHLKSKQSSNSNGVDMPSSAIASRLREASELHQLGISLSKATPIAKPPTLYQEKDIATSKLAEESSSP